MKVVISCVLLLLSFWANAQDGWELKKNEDGIKVYTRSFKGSSYKEFKGIVTVKAVKPSTIVALLADVDNYINWSYNCKKAILMKRGEKDLYYYIQTSAPWPVEDRDMVYYSVVSQDAKTKNITVNITGIPSYTSQKKGIVRMKSATGKWEFVVNKDNSVTISYQFHAEPGGVIPANIANAVVIDIPFNSLSKFRYYLNDAKYRNSNVLNVID